MSKKNEKKLDPKELAESLLLSRKNGFQKVSEKDLGKSEKFADAYKTFLDSSKTEREAVRTVVALAEKEGFAAFDPSRTYQAGDRVYFNNRGKALILAVIGKKGQHVRLIAVQHAAAGFTVAAGLVFGCAKQGAG